MNTISFSHTLDAVLSGKKTQTRRIWKDSYVSVIGKDGEICALVPQRSRTYFNEDSSVEMWTDQNMFVIHYGKTAVNSKAYYAVGGVNTVTGGRGKPAVWYIGSHTCALSDRYDWCIKKNRSAITQDFINHGYQPLQIRVTKIRVEDVRNISDEDVKAEGFDSYAEFMETWCGIHDKPMVYTIETVGRTDWLRKELRLRPDKRYKAVVLDFEVVK